MPDNRRPDQEHIILPIGIVKKSTGAGTTIRLIPPHPSADKLMPQANILTRDSGTGAHARAVVRVVEIQGNLAQFDIMELETEAEWPEAGNWARWPTLGQEHPSLALATLGRTAQGYG